MKQILGHDNIGSYLFDPVNKKIQFIDIPNLTLGNIMLITVKGKVIYNFSDSSLGGTIDNNNNILTLSYDTSSFKPFDELIVVLDLPPIIPSQADTFPSSDDDKFIEPTEQFPIATVPFFTGQQAITQSAPVALANEQFFDLIKPIKTFQIPAVGVVMEVQDCLQYRQVAIQLFSGIGVSAGVATFEGSNSGDYATWAAVPLMDMASPASALATTITFAASVARYFSGPIPFRFFRVRVTTLVAGGQVSIVPFYRMAPYSSLPYVNMSLLGGTAPVNTNVAGTLAVGGNIAPGTAPTSYPMPMGAVDNLGATRRVLSDPSGQVVTVGPDPTKALGATTNPLQVMGAINPLYQIQSVPVRSGDGTYGKPSIGELLEMILAEMKLNNYYLKELPLMLSLPNGFFNEDISDFSNDRNYFKDDK